MRQSCSHPEATVDGCVEAGRLALSRLVIFAREVGVFAAAEGAGGEEPGGG